MEGTVVGNATCEILLAPQCDSSDNEQANFISGPKKSSRKRKRDSLLDAHDVLSSCNYKMGPIPWCMGFVSGRASESESADDLSESSSGAFYVVKGYESAVTAIVTDSEDDLYFLEEAVEFEPPGSDSEQEGEEEDEEDVLSIHTSDDEDPGADGGDEYEEDEESDSEIDEDDLWMCPKCNTNNHPMSRQCARCWTERLEWLPQLKRSVSAPVMEVSRDTNGTSPSILQKSASLAVTPAMENPGSLISSSLVKDSVSSNMLLSDSCLPPKRTLLEQAPCLLPAPFSETGEESILQHSGSKNTDSAFEPDLCVICLMQPRNASLVHGRTGHQVCCIGCAEKLREGKKKCPVCRKKIRLVVKNFF